MARGRNGGKKTEFPLNGPLHAFAMEVAREITRDLKEPYFKDVAAAGQDLVKTDHGNPVRT